MNLHGTSVKTGLVPEVLEMSVEPIPREEGEPITATLNADVFKAAVSGSATITLTYTTEWNVNPATLGVTVTGTPIAGDQISFISTGWNLYDHANTRARVVNYFNDYGYRIDGTYTALKFSETLNSEQTDLYVFNNIITGFPEGWTDGYIWVTGGNGTTTALYLTWSDWTGGYPGSFAPFAATGIDLSSVMANAFPYGMMRVASTYDELNLNVGQAISRIQRLEYSSENLQIAEESGRDYDTDENFIYLVRETPIVTNVSISSVYTANDHGLEWFNGSEIGVEAQTIYGASLKNKLERDVLTISQQTLSAEQQTQARSNIDAASASDVTALQSKYGSFGNSATPITNLDNLPINGDGNCALSATLSPTGNAMWCSFKKYGYGTYYVVLITSYSGVTARRTWVGNVANGVFGGWKELAGQITATVTVPKNNGTADVTYSSINLPDSHIYLVAAMTSSNNSWRFVGILYLQSTRTLLAPFGETGVSQLTATADGTKITFTNTNTSYDASINVMFSTIC